MKRAYNKPNVVFERFSLSSSIAAPCALESNFSSGSCGFEFTDEIIVFVTADQGCNTIDADGNYYDLVCYHNPTELNNLFNS